MSVYLLNSQIVPLSGDVESATVAFRRATVEDVKAVIAQNFVSAVGHEATAAFLTALLGVQVPCNRVAVEARPGDVLVQFKLKGRLPEGQVIFDAAQLASVGYDFWIAEVL